MFITFEEIIGTCYLEFQFCKMQEPTINSKIDTNIITHWKKDSLFIKDEEFNNFNKVCGYLFNCALLHNGTKGFDSYGINYYDKKITKQIFLELKKTVDEKYVNLVYWLEKAMKKYNGFYILGI